MIDFEALKKELAEANVLTPYSHATILNSNLIFYLGEEETFSIAISESDGEIVLSDFGKTIERLEEFDITLEDEDVFNYVEKVLQALNVTIGPSNELMVKASNEKSCVYAIGRLYQAIILISYMELQFEYEDDEE